MKKINETSYETNDAKGHSINRASQCRRLCDTIELLLFQTYICENSINKYWIQVWRTIQVNINQQKLINLHIESRANVNVRHNAPDNIVVNILATDWRRHVICSKMTDTAPSPTELCGVRAAFYMEGSFLYGKIFVPHQCEIFTIRWRHGFKNERATSKFAAGIPTQRALTVIAWLHVKQFINQYSQSICTRNQQDYIKVVHVDFVVILQGVQF